MRRCEVPLFENAGLKHLASIGPQFLLSSNVYKPNAVPL